MLAVLRVEVDQQGFVILSGFCIPTIGRQPFRTGQIEQCAGSDLSRRPVRTALAKIKNRSGENIQFGGGQNT